MLLSDALIQSSEIILSHQEKDGSFAPGKNGPYNDIETPVRNTAHWLISLLKAYELTNKKSFKLAAIKAADYLLSDDACPMEAAFFCRRNPHKDFSNGLIGQAWAIEALVSAGDCIGHNAYLEKAVDIFQKHYFDEGLGLWRKLNVDGSYSSFDMAFNHQLWFAMAGAMLWSRVGMDDIKKKAVRFLDRADKVIFSVSKSGRILHSVNNPFSIGRFVKSINQWIRPGMVWTKKRKARHKENGYHAFNLYAFSLIRQYIPDHPFWKNTAFFRAVNYINSSRFYNSLDYNEFAYPYNPAGFEVALAIESFPDLLQKGGPSPQWWVKKQFDSCYDHDSKLMNRNTMDKPTLAARMYEASRLSDLEIDSD